MSVKNFWEKDTKKNIVKCLKTETKEDSNEYVNEKLEDLPTSKHSEK